jgi:hypothetical protein
VARVKGRELPLLPPMTTLLNRCDALDTFAPGDQATTALMDDVMSTVLNKTSRYRRPQWRPVTKAQKRAAGRVRLWSADVAQLCCDVYSGHDPTTCHARLRELLACMPD